MANPTQFPEQNYVFRRPESMTDEECGNLPCHVHEQGVLSKWELDDSEIEMVKATGCVYANVMAMPPPPIYISGANPFAGINGEIIIQKEEYAEFIKLIKHAAKYAFFATMNQEETINVESMRQLSRVLKTAIDEARAEAVAEQIEDAKG